MPCSVSSSTGPLRLPLTEMGSHSTEGALVNLSVRGPGKRYPIVFQFDHRRWRFFAHKTDSFLVAKPIRTLDGVVHMPTPVIFTHIGERGTHPALCRNSMGTRREYFGDAGCAKTGLGKAQTGAKSRASRADDDHIMLVMNNVVGCGHQVVRLR